jgi:hypothetical protein
VVSYGCETWVLKKYCKENVLASQRKIYGPFKEMDING